jgi:hypothetical protein
MKSFTVFARTAGLVLGLALVAAGSLCADPVLYGITQTGTLFSVDPTTLATTTYGTVGGGVSVIGVATNGTNLYTFDRNTDRILQIDPNNASVIQSIDVGLGSTVIGEGDLTFSSMSQGYISSAQFPTAAMYSFNLGGTHALLHSDSNSSTRVFLDGLAIDGSTLYGFQQGGSGWYTVDTTTGVPTKVGNTGIAAAAYGFGGLAFDAANSTMYGEMSNNSLANLFTINPTTGAAIELGAIGSFANVAGLAEFDAGTTSTPEPGSVFVVITGLLGMISAGWLVRRRRVAQS